MLADKFSRSRRIGGKPPGNHLFIEAAPGQTLTDQGTDLGGFCGGGVQLDLKFLGEFREGRRPIFQRQVFQTLDFGACFDVIHAWILVRDEWFPPAIVSF